MVGFWARAFVLLCISASTISKADAAGLSASSRGATDESHFRPAELATFAKKVERELAATGVRVAIVGRVGVPLDQVPEGFHYSHVGFAIYSQIKTKSGDTIPGYAMYNLYQDDKHPDVSNLVQDYPLDFFSGIQSLDAGVIIPSDELQSRILGIITSPTYAALHDPHYSIIANPYNLGRQNCTEFVLDVLMAAIYRTDNIAQIKAAENAYFRAQPVTVSPFKLLVGSMFMPGVSTSDQTEAPVTATFERISDFLRKYDAGSQEFTVLSD
ncbi:DUF2145 domain-containing protein [Nitrospirillum iridis]|uniref:DUF2145 domain-containing protein n=1 Tax=Nitrospirillum iridis TaxID=765888 RepID=A0A7X0AXE9_9PROT|nr:DUF2145 domain-containing protein [Nitrospirillum iridis]MBB6251828.1 hypothetical protein [Nitrospirillum iridis]